MLLNMRWMLQTHYVKKYERYADCYWYKIMVSNLRCTDSCRNMASNIRCTDCCRIMMLNMRDIILPQNSGVKYDILTVAELWWHSNCCRIMVWNMTFWLLTNYGVKYDILTVDELWCEIWHSDCCRIMVLNMGDTQTVENHGVKSEGYLPVLEAEWYTSFHTLLRHTGSWTAEYNPDYPIPRSQSGFQRTSGGRF